MLSLGQKIVAVGSLLFVCAVSVFFSPLLSFLLVPFSIVVGLSLWKL